MIVKIKNKIVDWWIERKPETRLLKKVKVFAQMSTLNTNYDKNLRFEEKVPYSFQESTVNES